MTVNPSFASVTTSPLTFTVTVFDVSPAANETEPDGRTPPAKSAAFAWALPLPVTDQRTVVEPLAMPERVTLNVNGVAGELPELPSVRLDCHAVTESPVSSLVMVPVAEALTMRPPTASDSETVNASFASTSLSPLIFTRIVFCVSPAAKVSVPPGSKPPTKSSPLAG